MAVCPPVSWRWRCTRKPRIIELLLITTVPVMFLAEQRGVPNLWLVLATCFGGYLSAGARTPSTCH